MNPIQRVIKRHRVRTGPAEDLPPKPSARPAPAPPQKGVRLVQVDGRVQAIEVTCACGEVMVIEIEYECATEETVS